MELALLQYPANMPVVVRGPGIGVRMRMAPGARKIRAILRLQEGDQGHLAHCRDPSQSRGAADRGSTCIRSRDTLASLRKESPTCRESERFACLRKLAVRDAVGLRNRDTRLAKPLDDGVVQVAADRQGLFHIGDNATQLEFQRAVSEAQPEAQQECPGRWRLHYLRMRSRDVSQDFADLNRIAFIGDDDLD